MSYLARFLAKKRGENISIPATDQPPKPTKPPEIFSDASYSNLQNLQNPVSEVSEVRAPAIREIFPIPEPLISQAIPMAQPEPVETPSNPAPFLSLVVPKAPAKLDDPPAAPMAVEADPVFPMGDKPKPAPMTELQRLEGTYRSLYRLVDTQAQPEDAYRQLADLASRIRRLSPGFDFTALHLEEGAALMTEPIPSTATKAAGACYVCGGLESWRSVKYREPLTCSTCHPPANPEGIEREHLKLESEGAAWDGEDAYLIAWLATALPPSEPFTLSSGRYVSDPALWLARLQADAAKGPRGPRARTGALQDDVRAVYRLMNSEAAGALPGSEE